MNFGQALAALISGGRITCAELNQPGAYLELVEPAGNITERFIALHRSNGTVIPWSPTQEAIFGNAWTMAGTGSVSRATSSHEQEQHAASTR